MSAECKCSNWTMVGHPKSAYWPDDHPNWHHPDCEHYIKPGGTMRVSVLDHGYVEKIEHYGSDQRIIEAARMSTDKGFLGWGTRRDCKRCLGVGRLQDQDETYECPSCKPGDEKLLKYLYEHKHSTPFEMAGLIIEVKAPIFIYRQWHRHRTQSYNEMSARYTPLPDENYLPTVKRLLLDGGKNKQARGVSDIELTGDKAMLYLAELEKHYEEQERFYQWALKLGVSKELARIHIGVGRYSKMRAHANLRNWLAFLTLRMDPHAQWEIRQYANAIGGFIQVAFPRTWELFIGDVSNG